MSRKKGLFTPDASYADVFSIPWEALYDSGKRGVIFDIDNTLVTHGSPPDDAARDLFAYLSNMGFKTCLVSNNKEPRVKSFAKQVGAFYIFKAGKPKKKGYLLALSVMGVNKDEALSVGDQFFTDIAGANRAGILNLYVAPIDPSTDPPFVRFKRRLEKLLNFA